MLATPAGERHELGLLTAALCAQDQGARVFYLGSDLPTSEIVADLVIPQPCIAPIIFVTNANGSWFASTGL